jgi:ribonucleoside-diphosphate reductase alpha chain
VEFFEKLGAMPVGADGKEIPKSIFTAPKEAVIGFLQGLFTSDGTVGIDEGNSSVYVRLTAKSRSLLKGAQLLLLNLGMFSRIYKRSRPPRSIFPYLTVAGEAKMYVSDGVLHELNISRDNIPRFLETIGFFGSKHRRKVDIISKRGFYSQPFDDKVASVVQNGKKAVYDLTEPMTHSFIANGFAISNCGEQPLLPYESCNLGSVNLSKMISYHDEVAKIDYPKLRKVVRMAVRFLDDVIDMNNYPLLQIDKMTRSNRKIGLGVMGFADMLIRLGIPYNAEEAVRTGEEVMKFIHDEGVIMSQELAKERGPFPNFKKSIFKGEVPRRNATITTIAPTGTISIIANASSGIEPLFAISYIRKNILDTGDELIEVNPVFEEVAYKSGFYSDELMRAIAARGSIREVKEIPEDIRKAFVTAHDITPDDHIRMQAAFQKYTDNAVSKTVNFPNHATTHDVEEVYILAYKLGCKGVTIYRDQSRKEQVLNIIGEKKEGCEKCAEGS